MKVSTCKGPEARETPCSCVRHRVRKLLLDQGESRRVRDRHGCEEGVREDDYMAFGKSTRLVRAAIN